MKRIVLFLMIFISILTGCHEMQPFEENAQEISMTSSSVIVTEVDLTETITPTLIEEETSFAIPTTTLTPISTSTMICMPFSQKTFDDMKGMISNPYDPPEIGVERVHQGVDFAVLDEATGIAISGEMVQSVLSGKVIAVLENRFPYGNAILIESDLDQVGIPQDRIPQIVSSALTVSSLYCPDGYGDAAFPDIETLSIYLLYAHLETIPNFNPGSQVKACTPIASVGMSGNALNPHLHLEIRIGPAGLEFSSMAHYDNSASLDEMANYCFWRVSGFYQFIDPMLVLEAGK